MENNFNQNTPVPEEPTQDTCQLDGTDGNQHQAKAEGTHPPHFDRGFGGRFGRGLRGGFLAGILAGILGRFLRHRDILVKIVFHS